EAGPDQLGAAAGAQRLLDLVAVDPVFAALLLAPDRPDVPAPLGGELRLPEQLLHGERGLVGLARGREAVLAGGEAREGARRLGGGDRGRGLLVLRRRPQAEEECADQRHHAAGEDERLDPLRAPGVGVPRRLGLLGGPLPPSGRGAALLVPPAR